MMMTQLLYVILIVNRNIFLILLINDLSLSVSLSLFYLDAITEQQMPMTAASMFWLNALYDCNLDRPISFPYDRHRPIDKHRTTRTMSTSFHFGEDLSYDFVTYALSNEIQSEHLALGIYYIFLFKLTNGDKDLCIGLNINNRYKDELKSIIGLFENIIPLRCQLDPHWSFHQLIEYVQEISTHSLDYSYFPLQRILAQHPNVSKPTFLDTSFIFQSTKNDNTKNEVMIGTSYLHLISNSIETHKDQIIDNMDFSFLIKHDPSTNQVSYTINASLDLFDTSTIDNITQRFHSMLKQIFTFTDNERNQPIYNLSLILPDERLTIISVNNTQVLHSSITCIHQKYVYQMIKYPQKLAVELDEQSLTYAELLPYIQLLAIHLLDQYKIVEGEIISQCVERSLSMVSS